MLPNIRGGGVKKPKPFQRPGITLSEDLHGSKRRWVKTDPRNVHSGDIIRGAGLVEDVMYRTVSGAEKKGWVSFRMKNGSVVNATFFPEMEHVIAFTEAEGEPVG